jgi:hypothetical protein
LELVEKLAHLLSDWPTRLVNRSVLDRSAGKFTSGRGTMERFPTWLWQAIYPALDGTMYVPSEQEIDGAIGYLRSQGTKIGSEQVCRLLGVRAKTTARIRRIVEDRKTSRAHP